MASTNATMQNQNQSIVMDGITFEALIDVPVHYAYDVTPLSVVPMERSDKRQHEGVFGASSSVEGNAEQLTGSSKRPRKKEGDVQAFFKLRKFPGFGEQYMLEMYKGDSSHASERCLLQLQTDDTTGKQKVHIYDLELNPDHVPVPVSEDPGTPLFPKKTQFSLQERLVGWTIETRTRPNGKDDTFYYHGGRQFRSFVEAVTFVLYACKPRDMERINTNVEPASTKENEAAKAMMSVSSTPNRDQ